MEVVIAMSLGVLVVGAFAVFTESTGRTLVSLTSQSSHNQYAGNGTEFLISRIRQANTAYVDSAGITLTLGFDDNPDVDSNSDKIKWNDRDHFERFQYVDGDSSATTLTDNKIVYWTNIAAGGSNTIVPADTRKLASQPIFNLANGSTVQINFGLLTTNSTPFSQAIEIRTTAVLRNRTR